MLGEGGLANLALCLPPTSRLSPDGWGPGVEREMNGSENENGNEKECETEEEEGEPREIHNMLAPEGHEVTRDSGPNSREETRRLAAHRSIAQVRYIHIDCWQLIRRLDTGTYLCTREPP